MPNSNKCRTCGHCWENHNHHGRKMCHELLSQDYDLNASFCDCNTGWLPEDNLEFLELKYDRSKLAINSRNKSNEDLQT